MNREDNPTTTLVKRRADAYCCGEDTGLGVWRWVDVDVWRGVGGQMGPETALRENETPRSNLMSPLLALNMLATWPRARRREGL